MSRRRFGFVVSLVAGSVEHVGAAETTIKCLTSFCFEDPGSCYDSSQCLPNADFEEALTPFSGSIVLGSEKKGNESTAVLSCTMPWLNLQVLYYFPGTKLWEHAKSRGLIDTIMFENGSIQYSLGKNSYVVTPIQLEQVIQGKFCSAFVNKFKIASTFMKWNCLITLINHDPGSKGVAHIPVCLVPEDFADSDELPPQESFPVIGSIGRMDPTAQKALDLEGGMRTLRCAGGWDEFDRRVYAEYHFSIGNMSKHANPIEMNNGGAEFVYIVRRFCSVLASKYKEQFGKLPTFTRPGRMGRLFKRMGRIFRH